MNKYNTQEELLKDLYNEKVGIACKSLTETKELIEFLRCKTDLTTWYSTEPILKDVYNWKVYKKNTMYFILRDKRQPDITLYRSKEVESYGLVYASKYCRGIDFVIEYTQISSLLV